MRIRLLKKLRTLWQQQQFEADLEEEIRIHREMSGEAAFGSVALAMEGSRDVWGMTWLESWKQDVRYALRGFRRAPGFALGVIAAIGLGIGLNTTMFTVFNAYALRPHAVRDPYRLYDFTWYEKTGNGHWFTWNQYQDAVRQKEPFSDLLAYMSFGGQVNGQTMYGQLVSGNYFTMLGGNVMRGRPLLPSDGGAVMVLGYDAWRNKFAGDPDIVGRTVYLRGQPFEVVGIATPSFRGLEAAPVMIWIPLRMAPAVMDGEDLFGTAQPADLRLIGRLAPGVTPEAAKGPLLAWARGFASDAVGVAMTQRATSLPIGHDAVLSFLPIFVAFGLVLLIACSNVSNMMLARALARQREIAIRVSLGAGRARLVRQLLTECAMLALPAAAAGYAISEATIRGAMWLLFATVPPAFGRFLAVEDLSPDWRVFGFILAASLATALFFGLAPAIQTTRSRIVEANRGDFSSDYRPARLRNLLVVGQVAVCTLLLVTTAIVLRTSGRVMAQRLDLDTHGVWDVRVLARYQQRAAARLATVPGVETVAAAWRAPLYGSPLWLRVTASGSKDNAVATYNMVSAEYFPVFRIPVVRGRFFTEAESAAEAPVAIVSESAARRFWPGQDAIGQTVTIPPAPGRPGQFFRRVPAFSAARVIGVAPNSMTGVLANGKDETDLYFPTHAGIYGNDSVLVRMKGDSAGTRQRLEAALDEISPSLADLIAPMDEVVAVQLYAFRITAWVSEFLTVVGLLLTLSGIYGVMSYLVSQRTKEIGIRVALGAGRAQILRMVLQQSAWLAGIGAAIGAGLALAVAPVFAHQIDALKPYEWEPYAVTSLVILAAAVLASYAPARRALGIDPVRTLRCD